MPRPPSRVAKDPRMSVNQLAQYMVSSPTGCVGIIDRAKHPNTAIVTRYKDARQATRAFLVDQRRDLIHLVSAENMLQQKLNDPAESAYRHEDARLSIDALHALQRMQNALAQYSFVSPPSNIQQKLVIAGVTISVSVDMLVHGKTRKIKQIGAAVLRLNKDDEPSSTARDKRKRMGLYAASVIRRHVEENIPSDRTPANKYCMSIDVQHGEVFVAANSNIQRITEIENACRFIAALWPQM